MIPKVQESFLLFLKLLTLHVNEFLVFMIDFEVWTSKNMFCATKTLNCTKIINCTNIYAKKKKEISAPKNTWPQISNFVGSTIWYQREFFLFQQDFESVLHTLIRLCVCCIFHITWQQFPQISKLHVCHMYSQFIYFSPCTYQRCFYNLFYSNLQEVKKEPCLHFYIKVVVMKLNAT